MLSQLITLIYNLADTIYVGHTGDPNQVAAMTLSFPIFMGLTLIANLFGIGSNSLISRSLGSKDPVTAKRASAFGFYGAMIITAIYAVVLRIFMRPLIMLVGGSVNTVGYADAYLTWTVIYGGLPTMAELMLAHLLRSEGHTREASIGMAVGGVINIVLDPVFIFAFGLGIKGAAMATAISNALAMVLLLVILYRKRSGSVITLSPRQLGLYGHVMSQVILVGIPAASIILLGSAANMVQNHLMAPYGDIYVAAYGVTQKLGTVTIQITVGLTNGIMPLIGYNFAAKNAARMKKMVRTSFAIIAVFTVVCLGLIELMPGVIVSAFINDAATIEIGREFVRRWFTSMPGTCIVLLFNSILQAMGKWKLSIFIAPIRQGLLLIPALILLNHVMGTYGLVWAQPICDTVSAVFAGCLYLFAARSVRELKAG